MGMTPMTLAANLAKSEDIKERALGVAMVARGLSDDDPATHRAGWDLGTSITAAIRHLGIESTPELVEEATRVAPTISDAMLNR